MFKALRHGVTQDRQTGNDAIVERGPSHSSMQTRVAILPSRHASRRSAPR